MLKITLFGELTLRCADITIRESNNRSKKIWRALAYLLHRRNQSTTVGELARFLRDRETEGPRSSADDSLVKITLHRIRALLLPLAEKDPACRLLCRDGIIRFDPTLTIAADSDRFDTLFRALAPTNANWLHETSPQRAASLYTELCALYRGRYLSRYTGEAWCAKETESYRRRFLDLSESNLPLLFEEKRYDEIDKITRCAIETDPYSECFHYWLIRQTAARGDIGGALALYDNVLKLFYHQFRLNPSLRLRRLRRELTQDCLVLPFDPAAARSLLLAEGKQRLWPACTPEEFTRLLTLAEGACARDRVCFVLLRFREENGDIALLESHLSSYFRDSHELQGCFCLFAPETAALLLFSETSCEASLWQKKLDRLRQALEENKLFVSCRFCTLS